MKAKPKGKVRVTRKKTKPAPTEVDLLNAWARKRDGSIRRMWSIDASPRALLLKLPPYWLRWDINLSGWGADGRFLEGIADGGIQFGADHRLATISKKQLDEIDYAATRMLLDSIAQHMGID